MTEQGTPPSRGNNLDPWYDHYAERTSGLAASEVRALFAVASRPEVVSLAGGMPYVSALPEDLVVGAMERVMREQGPVALQYGSGQGVPALREQILEVMALEGISGSADDVVVTTGSQHALELFSKLFIDPGDVVLAEGPSYVTAMVIFRSYQAEVDHVPMDEHGLIPSALREHIARLKAAGRRVKFLYTVPTFHNPAGVTLSWERRLEILEIAKANDILVLEDNPYGLLYFGDRPPTAMRSVERDGVVYLGTFSKTLAPGFRVGWALAPHAIREKLILANEAAVLSPSSFSQLVISEYLRKADWKGQIDTFRGVYRERKEAMISALKEHLPELDVDRSERRLLRLAHASFAPRLEGDASPGGHRAGRVHPRHGVLRRRLRGAEHPALVLLPDAREHPGRHPPARERHQRRTGSARHLRRHGQPERIAPQPQQLQPADRPSMTHASTEN